MKRVCEITDAYIAGAASRAKTLKGYLDYLYPQLRIIAFLVDTEEGNDETIDGIPVWTRNYMKSLSGNIVKDKAVFIATKGIHHDSVTEELEQCGFHDIIPLTVDLDNFFRNQYVKKYFQDQGKTFIKMDELLAGSDSGKAVNIKTACAYDHEWKEALRDKDTNENAWIDTARIYMAKSIYDKSLQTRVDIPSYMQPIQVGAALTEERLEDQILTDCTGDHISEKNRQYSELTALYWIWKQAKEEVAGLCHYRRHFVLPEDWLRVFSECGVDVILPVPTFVLPSIEVNYKERHDASDWDFLMEVLQRVMPEDYGTAREVFQGRLYSPCNMFIARRDIMEELCAWMFPILFEVEKHGGTKEDVYQNRYPGFISERLITLFFHMRSDRYRIVYADKTFYQ